MTPHPTDESELTEPLELQTLEPYHPRDALRLEMQARRDGFMIMASQADSEIARAEYLEYVEHCEALMRHVDHWTAWHAGKENEE